MEFIFFAIIFLLLFLSTQYLTKSLSFLFFHVTKSKKYAIMLLSFVFLPGVIVHELAHACMAYLFFVPVGKMEFLPVAEEGHVKLGSVQIGKTDPFRRFFIGIAPVVFGLLCLFMLLFYLVPDEFSFQMLKDWKFYLLLYAVFQISNTMFSSRRDLEGAVELLLAISLILIILYVIGIRVPDAIMQVLYNAQISTLLYQGMLFLLLPLGINMLLILVVKMLFRR